MKTKTGGLTEGQIRYRKYKDSSEEYRHKNVEWQKNLRKVNYDKYLVAKKKWNDENREKWLQYKKNNNYKRRGLGFIPLNDWFNNAVGHHINKDVVIFIPEELHSSIRHNLHTGKNMKEINDKAFEFLEGK